MAISRICSIPDCGNAGKLRRGWCNRHWLRWKRHGDPLAGRTFEGDPLNWIREIAIPFEGDECLEWPFTENGAGYGQIKHDGRRWIASRLVCHLTHGEPPNIDDEARHSCGNGHLGCVNPRHLSWGTRRENMQDMVAHGKSLRGENSRAAKLTEERVRAIRERARTQTQRSLAIEFGVTEATVSEIVLRQTWAWLD